jgi:tetratricopeptide (TPR) repeat protein
MFRYIVLFALGTLFNPGSVAQAVEKQPAESAPEHSDGYSPAHTGIRSGPKASTHISIARLRVPRKARQLYEKAMDACLKHAHEEAERRVNEALKIDPAFPEALTLHGGIQARLQQWEPAEESLLAAIRSDSAYSPAYVILAGVYNTERRFDEAQQAADRALSAGADTWAVQYEIARAFIGKSQYENALAICEHTLRDQKDGTLLHLAKGHALLGLLRYPEAAIEIRTYLRDDPSGDGAEDARVLLQRVDNILAR